MLSHNIDSCGIRGFKLPTLLFSFPHPGQLQQVGENWQLAAVQANLPCGAILLMWKGKK